MRVKDDFFLSAQLVGVWLTIYKVVLSFRDLIATIDEARMRKRAIAENAADVFCLLNEINSFESCLQKAMGIQAS